MFRYQQFLPLCSYYNSKFGPDLLLHVNVCLNYYYRDKTNPIWHGCIHILDILSSLRFCSWSKQLLELITSAGIRWLIGRVKDVLISDVMVMWLEENQRSLTASEWDSYFPSVDQISFIRTKIITSDGPMDLQINKLWSHIVTIIDSWTSGPVASICCRYLSFCEGFSSLVPPQVSDFSLFRVFKMEV